MKEIKRVYAGDAYRWKDKYGKEYAVRFVSDEYPEDPREWSNVGKMFCWHRHYKLGDDHDYKEPEEMWRSLVRQFVEPAEIIAALKTGRLEGIRAEEVKGEDGPLFDIIAVVEFRTAFGRSEPYEDTIYDGICEDAIPEWIIDDLTIGHCMTLLKGKVAWLGLSIYDHSGITMSYNQGLYPYNDRWDSSVVGWIVIDKETAMKELDGVVCDENGKEVMVEYKHPGGKSTFGVKTFPLTDETWEDRAIEVMKSEVDIYDKYLTGEVIGYKVYEKTSEEDEEEEWEEIDSLYGFYGSDTEESGVLEEIGNDFIEALEEDRVSEAEYDEDRTATVKHKFNW